MSDRIQEEKHITARKRIIGLPVPEEASYAHVVGSDGMSVRQKMTAAVLDLKKIYPLLFAAVTVIPRVESSEIPEIAVSPDTLYYNGRFVLDTPREELLFYLIHSIYHLLMRHHIRGEGKDPLKWNVACDYYINKCIQEAYGVTPDGDPVTLITEEGQYVTLSMPAGEPLEESVNLVTDTPESIYRKEFEEEDKEMSGESGSVGDSGRDGQGDKQGNKGESTEEKGDSGSGDNTDEDENSSDKGSSGVSEDSSDRESDEEGDSEGLSRKESDETGPSQSSPEENQDAEAGSDADNTGEGSNPSSAPALDQGSDGGKSNDTSDMVKDPDADADDSSDSAGKDTPNPPKTQAQPENVRVDLIEDEKSRMDSSETKAQRSQRLRSKIDTVYRKLQEVKYGRGITDDPVLEAEIHENLPRVNWRVLINNHLLRILTDEKSLSTPDRRFAHTGLYIEGPVTEENQVKDIKICIDTSASMNERDIADALFQIECLIRQYRIRAELIFWDEVIDARVDFGDRYEFTLATQAARGRGGTNPDCLFEAFAQTNKRGHTTPIPELVIIFTDGYFELPKRDYHRAFRDRTIWILCSEDSEEIENFKPGFGKAVKLDIR